MVKEVSWELVCLSTRSWSGLNLDVRASRRCALTRRDGWELIALLATGEPLALGSPMGVNWDCRSTPPVCVAYHLRQVRIVVASGNAPPQGTPNCS